ncbi:hypothetical protein X975_21484, partial [Stegodyphus mimosarum]
MPLWCNGSTLERIREVQVRVPARAWFICHVSSIKICFYRGARTKRWLMMILHHQNLAIGSPNPHSLFKRGSI